MLRKYMLREENKAAKQFVINTLSIAAIVGLNLMDYAFADDNDAQNYSVSANQSGESSKLYEIELARGEDSIYKLEESSAETPYKTYSYDRSTYEAAPKYYKFSFNDKYLDYSSVGLSKVTNPAQYSSDKIINIAGENYVYNDKNYGDGNFSLKINSFTDVKVNTQDNDNHWTLVGDNITNLALDKLTYGQGDITKYYEFQNLSFGTKETDIAEDADIVLNYSDSELLQRIENKGQTIGDINGVFYEMPENFGMAVYNEGGTIGDINGIIASKNLPRSDQDVPYASIHNAANSQIGDINADFVYSNLGNDDVSIYNSESKIGDITGDFVGLFLGTGNSGLIRNLNNSEIGDISGNFMLNVPRRGYSSAITILNDNSKIGNITGDFIINVSSAVRNINNAQIGDISGLYYLNDCSMGYTEQLQVISNENNSKIGNINADFINNKAQYGVIKNIGGSEIQSISGNFIKNQLYYAGATLLNENSKIGSINANFIENDGANTSLNPGAISNKGGIIGDINGNFINNKGYVGAISNKGEIGNITGDFIGNTGNNGVISNEGSNSKIGDITGNFIRNTVSGFSAGVIENSGTIGDVTANFIQNQGTAIYSSSNIGDITGDFLYNTTAINTSNAQLGNITGRFIGHTAGAIGINNGSAGDINAIFINNSGVPNSSGLGSALSIVANAKVGNINADFVNNGGTSLYLAGSVKNIFGDFIGNKNAIVATSGAVIDGDIVGNFINNTGTAVNFNSNSKITGKINANFIGNQGGGIFYNSFGDTIKIADNLIFADNAASNGAAICVYGKLEAGDNLLFYNNKASNNAAIFSQSSNMTFGNNNTFANNIGGAIYNVGNIKIGDNALFANNTVKSAVSIYSGTFEIGDNAVFYKNSANSDAGAIYSGGSKIIIGADSVFYQNTSERSSGSIYATGGLEIGDNAYIAENEGKGTSGGAIFAVQNGAKFGNNTVLTRNILNSTSYASGGALYASAQYGPKFGDNTIITYNQANAVSGDSRGGAIYSGSGSAVTIGDNAQITNNSLTSENGTVSGGAIYSTYGVIIGKNSVIKDNSAISNSNHSYGGAINSESMGDFIIGDNTEISNNKAIGNSATAGALYITGNINIGDNVTITQNQAKGETYSEGGAIRIMSASNPTFGQNTKLTYNEAISNSGYVCGGAIYDYSGSPITIGQNSLISYNKAKSNSGMAIGGAIYSSSKLTIGANAEISNNIVETSSEKANDYAMGGAIAAEWRAVSGPELKENVVVKNNKAKALNGKAYGGAIAAPNVGITIGTNNLITDNIAESENNSALGGAIFTEGSATIGEGTVFSNNIAKSIAADALGGALYIPLGSNLNNIEFYNNQVVGDSNSKGGAVYYRPGRSYENTNFDNLIFDSNKSSGSGGAMYIVSSNAIMQSNNSTYKNNAAETNGGAIITESPIIANSDIYTNNSSLNGNGGALYVSSWYKGTNVTLVNNKALNGHGGAIYLTAGSRFDLLADNGVTLISGNTDSTGSNAIYLASGNLNTLNASNNGTMIIDDVIECAQAFGLGIGGDSTSHIYLNNKIINAVGAYTSNVNLHLGVTDKENHVSEIFAPKRAGINESGSGLAVNSGNIILTDGEATQYKFGRLSSYAPANWDIDIDWSKENGDSLYVYNDNSGISTGVVNLKNINIVNPLGEYKNSIIVQIIKNSLGDKNSAAIMLSLENFDESTFEGVPYLPHVYSNSNIGGISPEITLETTDTKYDSIGLQGYKLNTLEYITSLETKNGDKKVFELTENEPIYSYNGDEIVVKGDLTVLGSNEESTIDFNNKTTLKTDSQAKLTLNNSGLVNTKEIENKGTMQFENATMSQHITNKGNVVFAGTANNVTSTIEGDDGKVTFKEGNQEVLATLKSQNITNEGANVTLNDLSKLNNYNNDLTLKGGIFNIPNLGMNTFTLKSLNVSGGNMVISNVDADLAGEKMGKLVALNSSVPTSGKIVVENLTLLSDAKNAVTNLKFADGEFSKAVENKTKEIYTPIYHYDVDYNKQNGMFSFVRGGGNSTSSTAFNPAVLTNNVTTQAGASSAMSQGLYYAFEHGETFMNDAAADRFAAINKNTYALSTDFNSNGEGIDLEHKNKSVWVKPYSVFETLHLNNGPKVNLISYGSLIGFDSDIHKLKHGWANVATAYIGYNGSQIKFNGVDASTNGGLLGLTQTFYKGNFWTALTATAGAANGEAHTMYGKEDMTSLMAGIASKTGYNFEFKDGRYIIQPRMFLSYSFINTFDYTNSAGVRIDSNPMHTIQLNPAIKFIANYKEWQPYASVGMVWNLMNESSAYANGVKLPEMHTKSYVEYGLGVQKHWNEKYSAYGQAMVRNGGRNGIALSLGFRMALGKDTTEKVQKEKPATKAMKAQQNRQSNVAVTEVNTTKERRVIKQLSPVQRAHLMKNSTLTAMAGVIK